MKKILVTGGAGFVGRHFIRRFLEAGDVVYCVDNLAPLTGARNPEGKGWPLYQPRDYQNFKWFGQDCRQFFNQAEDTDFDYAFHLAAMVGGREMIENNPLAVADDLAIDATFWQWAAKTKPKKTICFSSSAAYPNELQTRENYRLLSEDMISFEARIGVPDMTYGWAKLTHEFLAQTAYQKYGLKSVIYRPFSGYGEDQDMTYPFPSICKRVLNEKGAAVIKVWGSGEQMRDFIHIEDCVDGVLATMDKIDNAGALNLSTGIYTSFLDFARLAAEAAGFHPKIEGLSEKPSGVFARGGCTKKQEAYGFRHKISFQDGIERALRFLS